VHCVGRTKAIIGGHQIGVICVYNYMNKNLGYMYSNSGNIRLNVFVIC